MLKLNRPIQVGFAILDLSKHRMYDFRDNTWMKKFPNPTILFTGTDYLAYEVVEHDIYEGIMEIKDEYDFSEYPNDHALYSMSNMKKVRKFKDECMRQLMLNFIGLRPKLYSFDYERIAYFDIDKNGIEIEVGKSSDTTTTRIIRAKGVRDVIARYLS